MSRRQLRRARIAAIERKHSEMPDVELPRLIDGEEIPDWHEDGDGFGIVPEDRPLPVRVPIGPLDIS